MTKPLDMRNPLDRMVARMLMEAGLLDQDNIERVAPPGEATDTYTAERDVPQAAACTGCGLCCLNAPGFTVPSDLGDNLESEAARRLATGSWTVDWWDGDVEPGGDMPRIYMLRPAEIGHEGEIFHPGWGGACTMLGPNGCTLSRTERPTMCKALVPMANRGCSGMSKGQVAREWRDYSDRLHAVAVAMQEAAK